MELSSYDVEVIYKEGRRHGDADALSRHPCPDEPDEEKDDPDFVASIAKSAKSETGNAWRDSLQDEKKRIPQMVRELSKFNVSVIYTEKGRNMHSDLFFPDTAIEGENIICSLTTADEVEINFAAADSFMEIALVEIHSDEEFGKEMAKLQSEDTDISKVMDLLRDNTKDKSSWNKVPLWFRQNRQGLVINKDTLFHIRKVENFPEPIARTVIPRAKVKEMLFRVHGCMQGGHPGHKRALDRLQKFAVWPNMTTEVLKHVERCAECQATRTNNPKRMAPISPQNAIAPLQYIQADLFKTGLASNGMSYICVIEDRFSKFCKLYAIRDAKSERVAKCLESFVTDFGCPDVWGTDGGPEFYNTLIMAICHVFKVKKEFALAYRPQSQGQTERKNRTLKAELVKRISQFGKTWPSYLKWIEMAYNCTTHPSHGHTPFLLMFGREAKLPMQFDIPKIDTKGWETSMKTYLSDFLDRMVKFQHQAIANQTLYNIKMALQQKKNILEPIQPGQQVLREVPGQFRAKMDLPTDGPWQVESQRVKEGKLLPVYKIKNELSQTILAHRACLSPFKEPNFAINLAKPMVNLPPTPEPTKAKGAIKSRNTPSVLDGPASRTRAKRRLILAMPADPIDAETDNNPALGTADINGNSDNEEDPNNGGNDDEDDGGDDKNDDGDDDDDDDGDDDGDEGENNVNNANDEVELESNANSAGQFSELSSKDFESDSNEESTPENSLSDAASSSAYTTPESSGASPDELNVTVLDASQAAAAADEAENPYALEESLSASRPSLASTSSSITSNETSLADVFDYNSSWDREILTASDDDPLFANGHVVEMIVNRSGVLTEVKRSSRNKQPPK